MTMIAYAFLQYRRLKTARREKRINGLPPRPTLPAVREAILELSARPPPRTQLALSQSFPPLHR
jgi:hypothetical protein